MNRYLMPAGETRFGEKIRLGLAAAFAPFRRCNQGKRQRQTILGLPSGYGNGAMQKIP
ncbi:hypothetical protein V6C31_10205 [Caldibacillus debilis]|uniref:hypothetical protein n=1 Tax=Caldibacillus debilis TaxID=301148 RepID=UPI002FD9DD22